MLRCTSDDYTLRVIYLPPLAPGKTPDLERLRRSIVAHFEGLCNDCCGPVIPGRRLDAPCRVIDVNFGLNNQGTLRLMKVRWCEGRTCALQRATH